MHIVAKQLCVQALSKSILCLSAASHQGLDSLPGRSCVFLEVHSSKKVFTSDLVPRYAWPGLLS